MIFEALEIGMTKLKVTLSVSKNVMISLLTQFYEAFSMVETKF